MPDYSMRYTFTSQAAPDAPFVVITFNGREAFSECYRFDIVAAAPLTLDLDALVGSSCTFTMAAGTRIAPYHGVVSSLEQLRQVGEHVVFRAVLVPRFALLGYTTNNQVFLDKTIPEIITEVLAQRSLTNYTLALQHEYPARRYVCQFNESHLDFLSRWMEHYGIYYYFQQGETGEVLVVTDTNVSAKPCLNTPLLYEPSPRLAEEQRHEAVTSWGSNRSLVASGVLIKNYNYRHPGVDVIGETLSTTGAPTLDLGEVYSYGEDFDTPTEGKYLATVRAEELSSREKVFSGKSFCPGLTPGGTFGLEGHFQPSCNITYLVTEAEHHGQQAGGLPAELHVSTALQDRPDYQATLSAIAATVQFRPRRTRTKPLIRGMLNAVVESAPGSKYAMLDKLGRYKVRLPFDLSDTPATKASCWLRKAEPYAGSGHGMHFPLLGGTQVLLAFRNGDIDRPIIAAAVHDAEAVSPVTDQNPAANVIRTAGNNSLVMGDREGQEYICLHSPYHDTTIALGSVKQGGGGSLAFKTAGDTENWTKGNTVAITLGSNTAVSVGAKSAFSLGWASTITVGANTAATLAPYDISIYKGNKVTLGSGAYTLKKTAKLAGLDETVITGGHQEIAEDLVNKATEALAMSMGAQAMLVGGAQLESEDFQPNGVLSDQGGPVKGITSAAGALLMLGGLGASAATVASVKGLVDSFDASSAVTACSKLSMSRSGSTLSVNTTIAPQAELKMIHGTLPAGATVSGPENSSFTMSMAGSTISFVNMEMGELFMQNGTECKMFVGGGTTGCFLDTVAGASLKSSVGVTLQTTYKNSVSLTPAAVEISQIGGCGITLTEEVGSLSDATGSNGVKVTPAATKIAFGTNGVTIEPAGVSINSSSMVTMSASMVKIL